MFIKMAENNFNKEKFNLIIFHIWFIAAVLPDNWGLEIARAEIMNIQ